MKKKSQTEHFVHPQNLDESIKSKLRSIKADQNKWNSFKANVQTEMNSDSFKMNANEVGQAAACLSVLHKALKNIV